MTDLDSLAWDNPDSTPTPNGGSTRKCRRHVWAADGRFNQVACSRCGAVRDPLAQRRGMSAHRLGGDQERRIERVYGPRKVGEYGDACDHLGRDFKWQSKSTRSLPPKWLAAIREPTWFPIVPKYILDPMAHMTGIGGARRPLVIRSYVRQGVATRDWLFVAAHSWLTLHGILPPAPGYMVIPGADFLEIHGRDSE